MTANEQKAWDELMEQAHSERQSAIHAANTELRRLREAVEVLRPPAQRYNEYRIRAEKAEAALCRAKELVEALDHKSSFLVFIDELENALSSSSPCSHKAEVERLERQTSAVEAAREMQYWVHSQICADTPGGKCIEVCRKFNTALKAKEG